MANHAAASQRPGTVRKIIAVLLVLVGAVLIAVTLINNLFKVGAAFESMMDDFRPVLTQQSLATARSDVNGLAAVNTEFSTKLAPALSQRMGMTPEQFSAFLGKQFPAVATGMQALPTMTPTFNGLITTLDQQRPLFASADAIPTKNLPATTVPWSILAAGLLSILAGVLVWTTRRAGAVFAVVLGLLLVVGPFVLSLPGKASDADQLNSNLKPVYTAAMVQQAKASVTTVGAMGTDLQQSMLPALATQLKMSQTDLIAFMAKNFPATTAALATLPTSLARFQHLVTVFDQNLDNYATLKPVKFVPIVWTLIASGAAVFLLGVLALAGGSRAQAAAVPPVPAERYPGSGQTLSSR